MNAPHADDSIDSQATIPARRGRLNSGCLTVVALAAVTLALGVGWVHYRFTPRFAIRDGESSTIRIFWHSFSSTNAREGDYMTFRPRRDGSVRMTVERIDFAGHSAEWEADLSADAYARVQEMFRQAYESDIFWGMLSRSDSGGVFLPLGLGMMLTTGRSDWTVDGLGIPREIVALRTYLLDFAPEEVEAEAPTASETNGADMVQALGGAREEFQP